MTSSELARSKRLQTHDLATTLEPYEPPGAAAVDASSRLLLVVQALDQPRAVELPSGATVTLGRSEQADIVVKDPSLSRMHARFVRQGEQVELEDLDSRNGCWRAGERITRATLRVGGSVALGSVSVMLQQVPRAQLTTLGLLSAMDMLELIEDECARSRLFGRPLSLLVVRRLGMGVSSVARLAQRCAPHLRPLDRAAPHGNGSLVILLPETGLRLAQTLASTMLAADSGAEALLCGVASVPELEPNTQQLLMAADAALGRCSAREPLELAERPRGVRVAPRSIEGRGSSEAAPRLNPRMLELQRMVERLAPRQISVLVLGETGTGKELVARDLHRLSKRSSGPLKIVNCAAIPESLIESVLFGHVKGAFTGSDRDRPGVFAQAHGGTLVLDEVGELSAGAQAALLRVLDSGRICPVGGAQELSVDVRVVASTHRNLEQMAEREQFRLDLFHRLNSVTLRVPPLRERLDEIEALVAYWIEHSREAQGREGARPRLSSAALEKLRAYRWPGNVRELRNVVERALALCDGERIDVDALPEAISSAHGAAPEALQTQAARPTLGSDAELALRPNLAAHEVSLIREALRRTHGNQRLAAGLLQLPLRTLERKLMLLGPRARGS